MASKRYEPSKITIYPDHSTLSDAFKAHRSGFDTSEYAVYRPLREWFERVARDANLCLSTTHLIELVRWGDQETADAIARWYDAMPIVWTMSMYDDAAEFETDHWTKVVAGLDVENEAKPFASSLLTAFRSLSPDAAAALLAASEPCLAMVTALRRSPAWHARFEARNEDFIQMLMMVLRNHQWADAQGWSDERKRQETAANIRLSHWDRAAEADRRLTARDDAAYAKKQRSLREIQAGLIELYERDPKTMPLFRVIQRFNEGANAHVERGQVVDGQPSKSLRKTLLSAFGDWLHLMGAAYCDVFTCDGIVSDWLGDVRENLGLDRQLALRGYQGGPEAFVRDLMATFP